MDYLTTSGAFELAFGAVEDSAANESSPSVATLNLIGISPGVSGGVATVIATVATLTLVGVSPTATGGVPAVVPAVAILTLVGVSPAVLPSVQVHAAVLAVFGFEAHALADEWGAEPSVAGNFGSG